MNVVPLILLLTVSWKAITKCQVDGSWNTFASSPGYLSARMVILGNLFVPRYIFKGTSLIWARMDCSRFCATNNDCQAFSFYENEGFYVCELMSDNFCSNKTNPTLAYLKGSSVWDKLSTGMKTSCYETKFTMETCESIRPGCLGIYPNCYNCTKTCIEFYARYKISIPVNCTLWPDGDASSSVPVQGKCQQMRTYLISRKMNTTSWKEIENYRMSFQDMYRISRLNLYTRLRLGFTSNVGNHLGFYQHSSIDANGTLTNVTFNGTALFSIDIFSLGGRTVTLPFVNVTDDRYNCGSFWLLDPNNATFCPGGKVSMFGTVKMNSTELITSGMRSPFWSGDGTKIESASVLFEP